MLRTRFAPSPTGLLHVGNAYSALRCQNWAEAHNAELLLRIEDIDHTRCRERFRTSIMEDLAWLGLNWQPEVRIQSRNMAAYRHAITRLREIDVIYPCFCTRKQITAEIARMASAPHAGEQVDRYPGICRKLSRSERQRRMRNEPFAWRLDAAKAMAMAGGKLLWQDDCGHHYDSSVSNDVVIGRKDIEVSYHLAVVVDDADQDVTHIIRGDDLASATPIHRLLQTLLGLPEPIYTHHRLLTDIDGKRLAKRNRATTLYSLRKLGVKADQLHAFLNRTPPPAWPFGAPENPADLQQIVRRLCADCAHGWCA